MIGGGYEDVYSNPIINDVIMPLQHVITVGSVIVNGLILTLIFRKHGKEVGSYRILISCFAINDISYTILHYVTFPVPETFPDFMMFRGHGPSISTFWMSAYMFNYATGFPLLVFHFLYRMMALRWPRALNHFFKMLPLAIAMTFLCGATWYATTRFTSSYVFMKQDPESAYFVQSIFRGELYSPVRHSPESAPFYLICVYWSEGTFKGGRLRSFVALFLIFIVMFIAYAAIIICCVSIVSFMRSHTLSSSRSIGTMRLQQQLFKCLIYQTVIPLISAYFPVGICFLGPVFGFAWSSLSFIIPNICCIHPLFDGIVLILTVTEYRRCVLKVLPFYRRSQAGGRLSEAAKITPTISMNVT